MLSGYLLLHLPMFFFVRVKDYTILLFCAAGLIRAYSEDDIPKDRKLPERAKATESKACLMETSRPDQTYQESLSLQSCSGGGRCLFHGPLCQVKLVDQSFLQSITPGLSRSKMSKYRTCHMCFCRSQRAPFLSKWHHPPVVCFFICCCKLSPEVLRMSSLQSENLLWGTFHKNIPGVHSLAAQQETPYFSRLDHTEAANAVPVQYSDLNQPPADPSTLAGQDDTKQLACPLVKRFCTSSANTSGMLCANIPVCSKHAALVSASLTDTGAGCKSACGS